MLEEAWPILYMLLLSTNGLVRPSVRWCGDLEKTVSKCEGEGVVEYERRGKKMCREDCL